jgi:hypothetical protein
VALVIPDKDLTNPENQPLGSIPDSNGSGTNADEISSLETLRAATWQQLTWTNATGAWTPAPSNAVTPAFTAVSAAFPAAETATIATFGTAPDAGPVVLIDAGSGQAPLPIDLLRTDADGTIDDNPAFGAAAAGLDTLDGFSTTAMMLAQTSVPVDASTVNGANAFLYRLTKNGAGAVTAVTLLPELKHQVGLLQAGLGGNPFSARYLAEPPPIITAANGNIIPGVPCVATGGCSPLIGLQPAVGAPIPGLGTVYLPPLEESTSYAVVVTTRVKDMLGRPFARPTVAKIILDFTHILKADGVTSDIPGVGDATAGALARMQAELNPIWAPGGLPAGTTKADVAAAYTFKTQSITEASLDLVAVPMFGAGQAAIQGTPRFVTTNTIATEYGFDPAYLPSGPSGPIAEMAEVQLNTTSLLLDSQNGGAFDPAHPVPEVVTALVVIPNPALVTGACPATGGFTAARCAPLVVFHHGVTRARGDLLPVAASLAARGFVVVAIDGEKQGDRSYCKSDAECCPAAVCGTASTCAFKANLTTPVDVTGTTPTPIGVCESAPGVRGAYLNFNIACSHAQRFLGDGVTPNPACIAYKGIPYVSGQFLVSMNFFRLRDSLRQDVIDQSAVMTAFAPSAKGTDAFATHLETTHGLAIDPTSVYWHSVSLGSNQGVVAAAVNPRITRAVFPQLGATDVDIFANPQSFYNPTLLRVIAPVEAGSADYLKLLQVAKWILDPAEAANFARHVVPGDLVSPVGPMPAREVMTHISLCDDTVPNAQNTFLASQLGLSVPLPTANVPGRVQWYVNTNDPAADLTCTARYGDPPITTAFVDHGVILGAGGTPTLTSQAQTNAASFLASPGDQPSTVRP